MKKLILLALGLTLLVVVLGAYTRLTDAGLGCPDWPGCYGFWSVPMATEAIAAAEVRYPERPLEPAKAWAEMIHRYAATLLGLLLLVMALWHGYRHYAAWQTSGSGWPANVALTPYLLLLLVLFQGALGMWTVTLNLLPLVVMGHLLGGFTIAGLLFYWWTRQTPPQLHHAYDNRIRLLGGVAVMVVIGQVSLGGWTAANYASLACTELPICQGDWLAQWAPARAFDPISPPASSYEYGVLDYAARMTIHVSHRLGALITTVVLAIFWWQLRCRHIHFEANMMAAILLLQLGLGVMNVVASLPLWVAVSHNFVALLLLLAVLACNVRVWQGGWNVRKNAAVKFA